MKTGSDLELTAPARPENVALVRQALAGLADELGVDPALCADMKIALTEACTNVVIHAYDGSDGPLVVTMSVDGTHLHVGVRDWGPGMHPLAAGQEGAPIGFGLALIASLADAFVVQGSSAGTEVQMAFELSEAADPVPVLPHSVLEGDSAYDGSIVMSLVNGPLVAPVLGRVVSLLAARADFSIDRLSDAQLVSDALATHAREQALDGRVNVVVHEGEHEFDLRVGPLEPGGGRELVRATEVPGLGCVLEQLSDELAIEPADGQPPRERLRITLADRSV